MQAARHVTARVAAMVTSAGKRERERERERHVLGRHMEGWGREGWMERRRRREGVSAAAVV